MIHDLARDQFQPGSIGTFVSNPNALLDFLVPAVEGHEFPTEGDFAGQGKILLPDAVKSFVQPGVAPRSLLTSETGVVREYRGEESLYLDRTKVDLGVCDDVYAIVYEADAFTRDPQVSKEDLAAVKGFSHVLIVTLGNRGPQFDGGPPISPHRFMHNVAGGNDRWSLFFGTDIQKKAEELVAQSADEPIDTPLEESAGWEFCQWVTEIARHSGLPAYWRKTAAIQEIENEQAEQPLDPFISVAEKIFSSRGALVKTASSSMKYWKVYATVG